MGMYHEQYLEAANGDEELADFLARQGTDIDCSGDPGRTKQEGKDDADINLIIARCVKDPNVASLYAPRVAPVFADVSEIPDLQTAMQRQIEVEDAFMSLPAKVREFFGNDPMQVLDFVKDPKNLDKAVELGVAVKRIVEPPKAPEAPPGPSVPAPTAPAVE